MSTSSSATLVYPSHREADIVLRDGSLAHVRPVRPEDQAGLVELFRSLPDDDRRLRFFSLATNLDRTAYDEVNVDYHRSLGLLVTAGPDQRIVAHAMYAPIDEQRAEVAFAVSREFQGKGLASALLGQLAEVAAENGIHTFEANVLPENRRMLDVFRDSGFTVTTHAAWDMITATFPTSLSPEGLARFDQREAQAASNAIRRILAPHSVAIIGASRDPRAVGGAVVRNLLAAGFTGPIFPVNPAADTIQGLRCYPSVDAISDDVDLAVIAVPAARVVEVAERCGHKGVGALVVLCAGFSEVGPAGRARQTELLRVCRRYGMRLVGPNCIGVINTDPASNLNATFGPLMPASGSVGLATQSGALALAAIDFAAEREIGFSSVVSMGNKADLSGNDFLGYWQTDPRTHVVLLYLESFGNPRKFGRIARSVARSKPIVALKSGRSLVGARATASHTGALLAASDVTVDALFRQSGVIRCDSLGEMLDIADLLAHQPLPLGRRVGIVTNVGGPGVMCADACEASGLTVPELAAATQARLRALLPAEASVANPVDMLAAASADQYREAVQIVAHDPGIDTAIAIFLPPLATQPADVARAIGEAADRMNGCKPLLAVIVLAHDRPLVTSAAGSRVPTFALPEPAVVAVAHAVRYAEWRAEPIEPRPLFDSIRSDAAADIIQSVIARGGGWLEADEVQRVFDCYGIPYVEQRVVCGTAAAAEAAATLGGAVALKAIAPGLLHKSDIGAVRLCLNGPEEVTAAAVDITQRLRERLTGFAVQRMAQPGVEMLVGVVNDRQFGPTVACGAGGTQVELLRDVSVRLAPMTRRDASSMLRELRSFPLLDGFRGAPRVAVGALEDVLLRVSALAEDHPRIAELDCNPVIVTASGALVVDARVRVEPIEPARPIGARR